LLHFYGKSESEFFSPTKEVKNGYAAIWQISSSPDEEKIETKKKPTVLPILVKKCNQTISVIPLKINFKNEKCDFCQKMIFLSKFLFAIEENFSR
jgi:hypothetical protein